MVVSLTGLAQIRGNDCVVSLHGAEHLPVTDHDHCVGEDEGAIKPDVERKNSDRLHHSPPAQQIPRAEEEVVQGKDIGNAVDDQRYEPDS